LTKTGLNVEELIQEFEAQGEEPGLFAVSRTLDLPGYYEPEDCALTQFTPSQLAESDYDNEDEEPAFLLNMEKKLAEPEIKHSNSAKLVIATAISSAELVRKNSAFKKARRMTAQANRFKFKTQKSL
jgi:hypothetical protein